MKNFNKYVYMILCSKIYGKFFKLFKYKSFNDIIYFDIQFKNYRQLPLISIKPYFDINPEPFLLCGNKWIYEIETNMILNQIKSLCKKKQ